MRPCVTSVIACTRRHLPCSPVAKGLEALDGAVLAAVQQAPRATTSSSGSDSSRPLGTDQAGAAAASLAQAWQRCGVDDCQATLYLTAGKRLVRCSVCTSAHLQCICMRSGVSRALVPQQ